eukprot:XP_011673088.1 PREDICTED: voltage-dependent T-type calcium channel subunit alpha-1G [Strongylocentrotus purpuratus]
MSEESRGNVRIRTPPEEQILERDGSIKKSSPGSQDQDSSSPRTEREGVTISDETEEADGDGDGEGEDVLFPGLYDKIFYCFKQTWYPRFWCIQLICWPWFERISMMVIILNCITLGMYRPCSDIECDSQRCLILQGFDHFIFAFFAAEMVVKVMAMGFIGKQGYLGETWNRLDFFIVVAGISEYIMDILEYSLNLENVSLSAIRTIRVLRPLRAINRIPSLRILVMLLLDTLPMLGNVLMLCFFVFFIFGIIGVQLWKGLLRNRCFLDLNVTVTVGDGYPNLTQFYTESEPWTDYVCSLPSDKGMRQCSEIKPLYSLDGLICNGTALPDADNSYVANSSECVNWNQYYTKCAISDENPFLSSISFDNILYAWIAIFQPYELTEAIEISNLIFTSLFALEMILKIIAYGPVGYVSNGFNVFDGLIVIVSVVEVLQDGSGGLSVLRTFRLLRILKLVRFMPALRRQLLVMLRTMDNVATFFSLLALFIFIFR